VPIQHQTEPSDKSRIAKSSSWSCHRSNSGTGEHGLKKFDAVSVGRLRTRDPAALRSSSFQRSTESRQPNFSMYSTAVNGSEGFSSSRAFHGFAHVLLKFAEAHAKRCLNSC
jgi:hypothetical protein